MLRHACADELEPEEKTKENAGHEDGEEVAKFLAEES